MSSLSGDEAEPGAHVRPRLHVLLTVNAAWNIHNFRKPLVEALIADGHRVTVLAPRDDTVSALEMLGCEFVELDLDRKGLNPVGGLALTGRLVRHFRSLRPDCIFSFTIKNNIFGAFAAKLTGIAFVPNVTGLGTAFLGSGLLERLTVALYKAAFRSLPVVLFQNADDRDMFVQKRIVASAQTALLPGSGIDLERFEPSPLPASPQQVVFLMIARLIRDKGVREYIGSAKTFQGRSDLRFCLLGAPDPSNRTSIPADEIASWSQAGIIDYLGTCDDVRPVIAKAHCVVLPSYREGAPRTLIEAAAMSRPLIASDVPGCRDIVDHDVNGFLCKPRDSDALSQAFRRFIELPDTRREAMGQASRRKVEREFDVQLVVAEYRRIIEMLTRQETETR